MGMKKKILICFTFFDCVFFFLSYMLKNSLFVPLIFNIILLIMGILLLFLNKLVKTTDWYKSLFVDFNHEIYPDNVWYRKHDERNYDLVVLGSSPTKYAYDFSDTNIYAMNWAQAPQTLVEDFNLLKNFHSILKDNATVIINIMPFTSINKKTGFYDELKYVGLLDDTLIDIKYRKKANLVRKYPIILIKPSVKALLKRILHQQKKLTNNTFGKEVLSDKEFRNDANKWIEGWKKQFNIKSFEDELSGENIEGRKYRINLMHEMIQFCKERNYKVVIVIQPVSKYLNCLFTERFKENYIYSFLKEFTDVRILDYINHPDLQDSKYYSNSLIMNQDGAKKFTNILLGDL